MLELAPTPAAIQPFRRSLLGRPAWLRLLAAGAGLLPLWLAIAWAVAVP